MATRTSGSKGASTSGKSAARKSSAKSAGGSSKKQAGGIKEVLENMKIDESVVEEWRARLGDLGSKVDLKKSLDAAKKLASSSSDAIRKAGGKNPSLFYSGLAAIAVGAGMMTAAHKIGSKKSGGKKSSGRK